MQNDAIGLNDEQLIERLRLQVSILFQARDGEDDARNAAVTKWVDIDKELSRRLSALRAEVERLKSENVVMRELCEADVACREAVNEDFAIATEDRSRALDAYRAMKGGDNAKAD